jgi:hypothetical protein
MSYNQLVTPNLDPVLYQGGHTLTDWLGWCLLYGQTAFNVGWAGSNAWEAWNDHVQFKHQNWDLPSGVYVPIWFSGYHQMGHFAIYKDEQVWSSPYHHKPTADVLPSIAEVERIYGVAYVGWSEDIGGTRVIAPIDVPAPAPIVVASTPLPVPVIVASPPPPSGAAPIPIPTETYTLVVDVKGYSTSNSAANHINWNGHTMVPAGEGYYVFNKKTVDGKIVAYNLTRTAGVAGNWINPDDNHVPEPPTPVPTDNGWVGPRESGTPEPAPEPPLQPVVRESQIPKKPSEVPIGTQADNTWKSSYQVLNPQNRSEEYELVQPWTMKEYSGKKNPVPLADGMKLNITGTFIKNGVKFYRTRSARDEYFAWWYAVPALDDNSRAVIVKLPPEPQQAPDEYLTLQDVAYYLKSDLSKLKIWDVIRRKKVNK